MILGEALNLQMGYLFVNGFSIDARYTHMIADEFSYLNSAVYNNRPNMFTLGMSKYLSRNWSQNSSFISWTDGSLGISDYRGSQFPISGDETITRLMVTFSF